MIPKAIGDQRVQAHFFRGYWEDVGTIRSYYEANLQLCDPMPPFDFYDAARPVYTHPRFLPATKIEGCALKSALVSEGGILMGAEIERSVIGIRSRIGQGTQIRHSLILGADYYESLEEIDRAQAKGLPPVGIGQDCVIERAIVDKNARVGRGVRIVNAEGAAGEGRRRLLHPRRDRDRAEGRRDPRRRRDLVAARLVDLAVALARDPLAVAPVVLLELLERVHVGRLAPLGLVQDLALGELRLVHPAQLGDLLLLLVAQHALCDAVRAVLLLQPLEDQLVRGLRCVVVGQGLLSPPSPRV